jgi:hypothetical protein
MNFTSIKNIYGVIHDNDGSYDTNYNLKLHCQADVCISRNTHHSSANCYQRNNHQQNSEYELAR